MVVKIKGTALISAYLPNEGKGNYLFQKELSELEFIIDNIIGKNMDTYILGDINVDLYLLNVVM